MGVRTASRRGGSLLLPPRVTSAFAGVATIKRTELGAGRGARRPEVNGLTITCGRRGRSSGMGLALPFLRNQGVTERSMEGQRVC